MRQIMIGNSSYVPSSRKSHEKHLLIDGPFHEQKVYLSKNAFNTTTFTVNGETGKYISETEFKSASIGSQNTCKVIRRNCDSVYWLPRLYWKAA